ncbi:hypothetical protein PRZ48_008845 [Zasmidium cellare]|uniref:Uncharacterized protein n=1 Tax=Zasmidium cellare TaxID=395010 RepID=A0ABR0EGM2_ZASCE|nr:hypothetical protein PRZ48_008845 [Zasmidium cellare]
MFGKTNKDKGSGPPSFPSQTCGSVNPSNSSPSSSQRGQTNARQLTSAPPQDPYSDGPLVWPSPVPDPWGPLNVLASVAAAEAESLEREEARTTTHAPNIPRAPQVSGTAHGWPVSSSSQQPPMPRTTNTQPSHRRGTNPRPPVPLFNDAPPQPLSQSSTFGRMDTDGEYEDLGQKRGTRTAGDAADRE